jgi:hypothetical protein
MGEGVNIWVVWFFVLVAQNFSFTFVSRSRNSGDIKRHMIAALLSNGVWFASQVIIIGQIMDLLTGKYGLWMGIGTGVFYTICTLIGSLSAHWWALRSEKGKSAVGANSKYKQVTVAEWEELKECLGALNVRRWSKDFQGQGW